MATDARIDETIAGKRVVDEAGEEIGLITAVSDGTAYVDPDPGLTEKLTSTLGWAEPGEDDHPLAAGSIERITDEEVHVRRDT